MELEPGGGGAARRRGAGAAGGTAELQALLDAYRDWARAADRFMPLRVDCELDVQVPHPADLDRGLLTAEGLPVRYRDRVPLAFVDDRERHWLGEFHLVDRFGDPDRFHPDERSLLRCWAWEQTELSGRLIGTQVTELQLSPFDFRRTEIPRPHRDRTAAARKLAERIADRLFR